MSLLASRVAGLAAALAIFAAMPLLVFLVPFTLDRRVAARGAIPTSAPWLVYAITLLAFSALLFAVHVPYGTFLHSAVALLPHAYLLALLGVAAAVRWVARRRSSWNPERATVVFTAMTVAVTLLGSVIATWIIDRQWRAEQDLHAAVVGVDWPASPRATA